MIIAAIVAIAAGYQFFAIFACLLFRRQTSGARRQDLPVSVLKPVRGAGGNLREALESHSRLDGEYELLCGVASLDDPAVPIIREYPKARVIECPAVTANAKVGVLMGLIREARYPIIVVNDSDIVVEPDYLSRVTAPLADPRNGIVTCVFRTVGDNFASRFEGLSVMTEFAPSAFIARMVGVDEFAIGATLAFRKSDLERIGGFESIADYIADDYQLGHKIHQRGMSCYLSDVIVESHLGGNWSDVWTHQVRWARTIRVSKPWGYVGLPVTFATLWSIVAALAGRWDLALALLATRMAMAFTAGWYVLRSRDVLRMALWIPLRDLMNVLIWMFGLVGSTVVWRGRRLKLSRDGKITPA